MLLNLLSNAVKFTPPGGRIAIGAKETGEGVAIAVSDTGIGMREEDIPIALSRFGQIDATLARKFEGTGLGLPLAKQMVELHGGALTIESALGVGTTVTVTLPRERGQKKQRRRSWLLARRHSKCFACGAGPAVAPWCLCVLVVRLTS